MPKKYDFSEEVKEITQLDRYIRYQELVETAPDPMVTLDSAGVVKYINAAAEVVSGYKREEVVGKNFVELGVVAPGSLPKAIKEFLQTISGHPGPPWHLEMIRKDKTQFIVEVNHAPIRRNNQIIGVNLIMRYFGEKKSRK